MVAQRRLGALAAVVIACFLIVLTACSSKPSAKRDEAEKDELAQQFMMDLRDYILVYRNQPSKLRDVGIVVSDQNGSVGLSQVDGFYERYEAKEVAQLNIAFMNIPMVVVRIHFTETGNGYYYRYELDEDEDIAVTAKYVDSLQLSTSDTGKKTLKLLDGGKEMTFTFIPAS